MFAVRVDEVAGRFPANQSGHGGFASRRSDGVPRMAATFRDGVSDGQCVPKKFGPLKYLLWGPNFWYFKGSNPKLWGIPNFSSRNTWITLGIPKQNSWSLWGSQTQQISRGDPVTSFGFDAASSPRVDGQPAGWFA